MAHHDHMDEIDDEPSPSPSFGAIVFGAVLVVLLAGVGVTLRGLLLR